MKINVRYGADDTNKTFPEGTTIGDLKQDPNLRAFLGYGDNVNLLIGGVAQNNATPLFDGAVVVVETAANAKAA